MDTLEQLDVIVVDLQRLVANVEPNQYRNDTPCAQYAVRDLFAHLIGGVSQFAPQLRGEPAPDRPPLDLDRDDLPKRTSAALDDIVAATRAPGAFERTVNLPFGQATGEVLCRFLTVDGMVHATDIARSTGQDYAPPDDLVAEVLATARALIQPEMRDGDTFAAETAVPDDASNLTRLIAFTGRSI